MPIRYLMGYCLALALCTGIVQRATAQSAANQGQPDDYEKISAQWRGMLAKMRALQAKYQKASPDEQADIEKEFKQVSAEGRELAPRVGAAAEKAYLADPKKNKDAGDFLVGRVGDYLREDRFGECLRLAKLLIEHGHSNKALYAMAGTAAFNDNQFDAALQFYKKTDRDVVPKLDEEIAKAKQYVAFWKVEQDVRAAEEKANDLPRVKLSTTKGDIVIELFENEAPVATANFVSLVEQKFYDGLSFHRVLPGFMAQGGDPKGDGSGGPGYTIPCECYQPNHRLHFRGTLSMAHAGRDTGGSQFFLTFVPTDHLNGKHTAFGRIIEGMHVLEKLERIEPGRPGPKPDKIVKATVIRKRNHEYKPTTRPEK